MNYNGIPEQKIREALFTLNYEDQDEWIMSGMAVKHELGESGLDMWLAWSSLGNTYNQKICYYSMEIIQEWQGCNHRFSIP